MLNLDLQVTENSSKRSDFYTDVLGGLSAENKSLPCKYFYDQRGSLLFEKICLTDEYYVTRAELKLLKRIVGDIASRIGSEAEILEFGSGAGEKICLLLDELQNPASYTPMDISREILSRSTLELRRRYPKLNITPWIGDYTKDLPSQLPSSNRASRRVVFFPGSTISNFTPSDAGDFLLKIRSWLGIGGVLLIGVDTIKPKAILDAAYNDAQGNTAAFNLNLIHRISRELSINIDPEDFRHLAFYNEDQNRVEMYLESLRAHTIYIGDAQIEFCKGERVHTEYSYKYSAEGFQELANSSGFRPVESWGADREMFRFYYLEVL